MVVDSKKGSEQGRSMLLELLVWVKLAACAN